MMPESYSIRCRFCDVLLVGREQFIGHMIHSHDMEHGMLEAAWQSLSANFLNSDGAYTVSYGRGGQARTEAAERGPEKEPALSLRQP